MPTYKDHYYENKKLLGALTEEQLNTFRCKSVLFIWTDHDWHLAKITSEANKKTEYYQCSKCYDRIERPDRLDRCESAWQWLAGNAWDYWHEKKLDQTVDKVEK